MYSLLLKLQQKKRDGDDGLTYSIYAVQLRNKQLTLIAKMTNASVLWQTYPTIDTSIQPI